MKLSERAMKVKFSRSQWTARRQDKSVEAEIEKAHGAHDAGRYSKILLAKKALEEGQKKSNEARTFFYAQTTPYDDEGWRILTTKNYFPFTQEINKKISAIENADRNFLDSYPQYIEEARNRLNGLFNEMDYPPIEKIKKKFSVAITIEPLPDSSNFPGNLQSIIDDLSADLERRLTEIALKGTNDLWERLYNAVNHMATTLEDSEATFRDSLMQNIIDLCELLPRLNLMDDPGLVKMTDEVMNRLIRHSPEELRPKNAKTPLDKAQREFKRQETAQEAKAILKSMEAYFTPPVN